MNKFKRVTLSLLLATSMVQTQGLTNVFAKGDNAPVTYSGEVSDLTNQQLAALTNPILQSYTADESHKVWKMTGDTRLAVLANQSNIENKRLAEVVKLINSEFMEKEIVSTSALAMVYAQEKDAGYGDILIDVDKNNPITDQSNSSEAYKIVISENGVRLTGASENAVLYGLRTIQNLMVTHGGLVYGTIVDYPNVAERRVHVDCARKYISKDWFIRQIREMSYMKMNAIQMHFSENLGFRIECETDPSIVSDQYLTKAEVREIIAEAHKYGIKVIPSFDSPGHVDQILRAHPEYGQVNSSGQHYKSGLDVTNPEAVKYIYSLYDEYMELFKGCTDFHIGGDEYMEFDRAPFTTQYQSVLNNYAVEKYGDGYTWKDVISGYINDLAEHVHSKGFTPRIWNDGIYYGENSYWETKQKIVMHDYIGIDFWSQMSWNSSIARLQTFIDKGHDTIYNINASFFYYVLRPSKPTDGREQHSFDVLHQEQNIYNNWTPGKFQGNTISDDSPVIKGSSLAIWCDIPDLCSEDVIAEDISEEMRSLATKSWNVKSNSIATHDQFVANYTKLGNVAGYKKGSTLPDSGDFLSAGDLGKVTLRYVDENNQELKKDVVKYGSVGDHYEFKGDDIYGYRLVTETPATGQFTKEGLVYTFKYVLYTDKTELAKEIANPLFAHKYIDETYHDYQEAYAAAKTVFENEKAGQAEVDKAYQNIIAVKEKAVLTDYYPLYVEVTYPLQSGNYVAGYDQYKKAIENGKDVLNSDDLTLEQAKAAYQKIQDAKSQLMKPDGNTPTITATDNYYEKNNWYPTKEYSYEKMLDNDLNTKCWFGQEQVKDKEVKFAFPKVVNMTSVQVIQPENVGADALAGADIQISTDGKTWKTVGSIDANHLDYTATFEKTPTQYVRILLTETKGGYWYQISEVKFAYEQIAEDNTLRDLIKEAEELDTHNQLPGAVKHMIAVLIDAQKEYVKGSIDTKDLETQLRKAIDALKDTPKVAELLTLVDKTVSLKEEDYSSASWKTYEDAFNNALAVLAKKDATQKEVDEARIALDTAIKGLKPATQPTDKTDLQAAIDKAGELDAKKYTETSWKVLQEVLTNAKKVLENEEATQEEVDTALQTLNTAIKGLVTKPTGPTEPVDPDEPTITPKPDEKPNEKPGDKEETDNKNDKVETSDSTDYIAVSGLGLAIIGMALLKKKKETE